MAKQVSRRVRKLRQNELDIAAANSLGDIVWPVLPAGRNLQALALQVPLQQSQYWAPDRLLRHQMAQIQSLLIHAYKHVPFYRERLGPLAERQLPRLTMDIFRELPLLQRTDIQDAGAAMVTRELPEGHGGVFDIRTSGSTGRPLEIKGTSMTALFYRAIGVRAELWHQRDFHSKVVALKNIKPGEEDPRPGPWISGVPTGPGIKLAMAQPVSTLLDQILAEDPDYLQAHASTLRELIRHSVAVGRKPERLLAVKTESEMVEPDLRDFCRREWGVPISDIYSCQEANLLAIECPDNPPHYHIQSEAALVEVLGDDGKPCGPGETGRVVITSLHNYATPLVRYEIGDYAEVGEPCSCGRGLPVLNHIAGRLRNLAVLPSGEKVTPVLNSERVLNDLPIRQFQLIQKSVDEIEARIVVTQPMTGADEATFADYFRRGLGHEFPFRFVYVDDIPRQANGKYEVFRCEVET